MVSIEDPGIDAKAAAEAERASRPLRPQQYTDMECMQCGSQMDLHPTNPDLGACTYCGIDRAQNRRIAEHLLKQRRFKETAEAQANAPIRLPTKTLTEVIAEQQQPPDATTPAAVVQPVTHHDAADPDLDKPKVDDKPPDKPHPQTAKRNKR